MALMASRLRQAMVAALMMMMMTLETSSRDDGSKATGQARKQLLSTTHVAELSSQQQEVYCTREREMERERDTHTHRQTEKETPTFCDCRRTVCESYVRRHIRPTHARTSAAAGMATTTLGEKKDPPSLTPSPFSLSTSSLVHFFSNSTRTIDSIRRLPSQGKRTRAHSLIIRQLSWRSHARVYALRLVSRR